MKPAVLVTVSGTVLLPEVKNSQVGFEKLSIKIFAAFLLKIIPFPWKNYVGTYRVGTYLGSEFESGAEKNIFGSTTRVFANTVRTLKCLFAVARS